MKKSKVEKLLLGDKIVKRLETSDLVGNILEEGQQQEEECKEDEKKDREYFYIVLFGYLSRRYKREDR